MVHSSSQPEASSFEADLPSHDSSSSKAKKPKDGGCCLDDINRWWRERSASMMYTAHQACAYGSDRHKWTVLAHSHKQFCKINRCCPCESFDHRQKPWGLNDDKTFATSEETAYPLKLAGTIAATFGEIFAQDGWKPPVTSLDMQWDKMTLLHARVSSGHQPKASKIPPLVAEHKKVWRQNEILSPLFVPA